MHPASPKVVVLEALESVTDKRQAHLRRLITTLTAGSRSRSRNFQVGSVVRLINLVNREVGCIDVGGEFGLEGCADTAKSVKFDSAEEFVALNLISTTTAKAVLCVANKAITQD